MAFNWQKLFENWTWHNRAQAKDTPINATNLNKINNAIDGIDNRVVAVGEALDELVFEDVTVSGNPAVFESRSEQLSKQTTVNIEPIQDLHGYDKPWNGGAGKNKLNYDEWKNVTLVRCTAVWENNGVTLTATGDDSYTNYDANIFPTTARIPVTQGQPVTLSWEESTNTSGSIYIFPNGSTSGLVWCDNAEQKSLTYTPTSGITYITFRFGVRYAGNTASYKNIQIEYGSSATIYEPYTNICPISGLESVVVERRGRNIWDEKWEIGDINSNTGAEQPSNNYYRSGYIPVISVKQCYFRTPTTIRKWIYFYRADKSYLGTNTVIRGNTNIDFSIPEGTYYIRFLLYASEYGNSYNNDVCINIFDPDFNGQYATYEGYANSTTTLPTTVYGGTLDLTNGRLVVDRGYIASYNGETLPGAWISDRDVYTGSNSPTTGAQVVYELATPTITTITPSSLSLLKGLNVVSTNGESVEVTFNDPVSHDDLDGKLDKTDVATVEGDTASKAYAVNEFMLRSDGFYRVTAPIASGASITSSNTTKTTIGAVLTALLNS